MRLVADLSCIRGQSSLRNFFVEKKDADPIASKARRDSRNYYQFIRDPDAKAFFEFFNSICRLREEDLSRKRTSKPAHLDHLAQLNQGIATRAIRIFHKQKSNQADDEYSRAIVGENGFLDLIHKEIKNLDTEKNRSEKARRGRFAQFRLDLLLQSKGFTGEEIIKIFDESSNPLGEFTATRVDNISRLSELFEKLEKDEIQSMIDEYGFTKLLDTPLSFFNSLQTLEGARNLSQEILRAATAAIQSQINRICDLPFVQAQLKAEKKDFSSEELKTHLVKVTGSSSASALLMQCSGYDIQKALRGKEIRFHRSLLEEYFDFAVSLDKKSFDRLEELFASRPISQGALKLIKRLLEAFGDQALLDRDLPVDELIKLYIEGERTGYFDPQNRGIVSSLDKIFIALQFCDKQKQNYFLKLAVNKDRGLRDVLAELVHYVWKFDPDGHLQNSSGSSSRDLFRYLQKFSQAFLGDITPPFKSDSGSIKVFELWRKMQRESYEIVRNSTIHCRGFKSIDMDRRKGFRGVSILDDLLKSAAAPAQKLNETHIVIKNLDLDKLIPEDKQAEFFSLFTNSIRDEHIPNKLRDRARRIKKGPKHMVSEFQRVALPQEERDKIARTKFRTELEQAFRDLKKSTIVQTQDSLLIIPGINSEEISIGKPRYNAPYAYLVLNPENPSTSQEFSYLIPKPDIDKDLTAPLRPDIKLPIIHLDSPGSLNCLGYGIREPYEVSYGVSEYDSMPDAWGIGLKFRYDGSRRNYYRRGRSTEVSQRSHSEVYTASKKMHNMMLAYQIMLSLWHKGARGSRGHKAYMLAKAYDFNFSRLDESSPVLALTDILRPDLGPKTEVFLDTKDMRIYTKKENGDYQSIMLDPNGKEGAEKLFQKFFIEDSKQVNLDIRFFDRKYFEKLKQGEKK